MNAPEPVLPVSGPTVGRRLAAAREQRGLDQAAAARLSGLSAEVVRGLEAEDWAALGAPVYVRGWLARYCRVLDVEASSALAEYRQAVPAEPPPLRLRGEAPSSAPRGHHSLRPFAYLLSFALLGYVGWQAFEKLSTDLTVSGNAGLAQPTGVARAPGGLTRSEPARPAPVTASAPETTPAPAPAAAPAAVNPVAATPGHAAAPAPSMNPVAPATASPALAATTATPPLPVANVPSPAAGAVPAPAPAGPVVPAESRIELQASADSWAEVRDAGGKLLFQGTLRPGSPQSITGRPPFRMKLGHAQHVTIRLDDSLVDSGVYVPKRGSVARFTLGREPG